jgi:hypothetical protein
MPDRGDAKFWLIGPWVPETSAPALEELDSKILGSVIVSFVFDVAAGSSAAVALEEAKRIAHTEKHRDVHNRRARLGRQWLRNRLRIAVTAPSQ